MKNEALARERVDVPAAGSEEYGRAGLRTRRRGGAAVSQTSVSRRTWAE